MMNISPAHNPAMSVNVVKNTFFETRVDITSGNGVEVRGVRTHFALTALFLKLFGKIVEFQDSHGKTYYINKNSLLDRSPDRAKAQACLSNLVNFVIAQIKDQQLKANPGQRNENFSDQELLQKVTREHIIEAANQALMDKNESISKGLYDFVSKKTNLSSEDVKYLRQWLSSNNILL